MNSKAQQKMLEALEDPKAEGYIPELDPATRKHYVVKLRSAEGTRRVTQVWSQIVQYLKWNIND
jgi:hypothetical protein